MGQGWASPWDPRSGPWDPRSGVPGAWDPGWDPKIAHFDPFWTPLEGSGPAQPIMACPSPNMTIWQLNLGPSGQGWPIWASPGRAQNDPFLTLFWDPFLEAF